jgi:hypothetical protein
MENSKNKPQQRRRPILVFFLIALLAINLVLLFLLYRHEESRISEKEAELKERKEEYQKSLDNITLQLKSQIREYKTLENAKQSELDSLVKKLTEVEQEKNAWKGKSQISQTELAQLRERVEFYQVVISKKDDLITELRKTNQAMYDENYKLKEDKNELIGQVTDANKKTENLQTKVNAAGTLKAENVNINGIDDRGKVTSGGQYRAGKLDKLDVSFNVGENKFAKIGQKDVYMRVLEPAGTILYNPNGGSGKFNVDGKEMLYSARQQIMFTNTRETIRFQFDNTGEFQAGRHSVEFYCEGQKIGYGTFDVR